jgi:iron complex outermembrane recepter protein
MPLPAQHFRFPAPITPALIAVLLGMATTVAGPSQAQTSEAVASIRFAVPAGDLDQALSRFGRQAGIQIAVDATLTGGLQSRGLNGLHSVAAGLRLLLAGTGLEAVREDGGEYTLRRLPPTSGEATLAPVTVTADSGTKTDTPIVETPQSITVIGAEEIETLKSQSLQDAFGYVAGVNRAEGLDRTSDAFFLRGFKTGNSSVFRDGSQYVINYYNGRQEPYGLERIELLKGAASVLYGSAAPGGLINTVSKRPSTETLRELNVEFGSFDHRQLSGDFAGALDPQDDWSYRLTFLQRDSGTFIDHVPDDRSYVAPALKWQPDAATSLTLLAEYQKDHTVYVTARASVSNPPPASSTKPVSAFNRMVRKPWFRRRSTSLPRTT